jgi:M6 family metalloprotease-like protein
MSFFKAIRVLRQLNLLGWSCLVSFCMALPVAVRGINASPEAWEFRQPNGKVIRLHVRGTEWQNWEEDDQEFTVLKDKNRYVYADLDAQGKLTPTAFEVGTHDPVAAGLRKRLKPTPIDMTAASGISSAPSTTTSAPTLANSVIPPSTGTLKNLVVLCIFSDHVQGVHTHPPLDYDILMNAVGGHPTLAPTGSVHDYFEEVSYGKLDLQSTVTVWVVLPHTEAYYANGTSGLGNTYPKNAQGMVVDAMNLVDPLVDFSQFDANNDGHIDAITIIHSGYGAEFGGGGGNRIWSHKWDLSILIGGVWLSQDVNQNGAQVGVSDYHTEPALWGTSGTAIGHIGVTAHETGHFLGLPDLYDIDGTSQGIGSYCLMANSWGFDNSQLHPPHMGAWCKIQLGWLTPNLIDLGTYDAPWAEFSDTVYRINRGFAPSEYLLVENRQPVGMESDIPQGGIVVWHIDETVPNNNTEGYPTQANWPTNHYKVALLQADGRYDLEHNVNRGDATDVYHLNGVSTIGPSSVPNIFAYQGGLLVTNDNLFSVLTPSGTNMTFSLETFRPDISIESASLSSEGVLPTNGVVDPGEWITLNVGLTNIGRLTTNLLVTLLPGGGISNSFGPVSYGALIPFGPQAFQPFALLATGQCGGLVTATFSLQDGTADLGILQYQFNLGKPVRVWHESFDQISDLPPGWTTSSYSSNTVLWRVTSWRVTNDVSDTLPNAVFVDTPPYFTDTRLTSPSLFINSVGARLSFRHDFYLESFYDGGVLEIAIAPDTNFVDIVQAGGHFVVNGYRPVPMRGTSLLAQRRAWSGDSGGFITTQVDLPPGRSGPFRAIALALHLQSSGGVVWLVCGRR